MEEKKTVVWHGGLEALLGSSMPEARGPQTPAAAPEDTLSATQEITEVTVNHLRRLSEEARETLEGESSEGAKTEIFTPAPRVHNLYRPAPSGTRIMRSWLAPEVQLKQAPAPGQATPSPAGMSTEQSARDQAATRIHPIESLFAGRNEAEPASAAVRPRELEPAQSVADTAPTPPLASTAPRAHAAIPSSKLKRMFEGENRSRTLLYGLLTLVCVAGLTVRLVRTRVAAESPTAATATAQAAPPAELEASAKTQLEAQPGEPEDAPIVAPHGLERAAVDALARGDHALAQRIYLELAGKPEAAPTFREAARILARNAAMDAR